jgi:endonuclease/exonuclease/phosphatase family metal-dependent hydrolase
MKLVTWNIQWGLGCDGRIDLGRTVATARALCDADVFCFQEVSHGFPEHDGGQDQPAMLASLLPGYWPILRPAVEKVDDGGRLQVFGDMMLQTSTLSRPPTSSTDASASGSPLWC